MKKTCPLHINLIIAHILKKSREYVLAHPEIQLTKSQKMLLEKLKKRLQNGEPLAYILGQKEFYGLEFAVDKRVLIPRPETELMVEMAIETILSGKKALPKKVPDPFFLIDVGTGSGCVIVSLAKNLLPTKSKIKFVAADISKPALAVARKNAKKHGVDKKIKFVQSDLLDFLIKNNKLNFPTSNLPTTPRLFPANYLITANLPYLSQKIYQSAGKSVREFEPQLALISGQDGLDHYCRLFKQIKKLQEINPRSSFIILLEISPEQKKLILQEISANLPTMHAQTEKDLAGKWRLVTIATKKPPL